MSKNLTEIGALTSKEQLVRKKPILKMGGFSIQSGLGWKLGCGICVDDWVIWSVYIVYVQGGPSVVSFSSIMNR